MLKRDENEARTKSAPLIFVVDDEPMIGKVVEAMLLLEGYRAKVFHDPKEALKCIGVRGGAPHLLLTDFLMPEVNGMELIVAAKKIRPQLKTILFSGHFGEDVMNFYPVKPDHFLIKPFQARVLNGLVRAVLE